MRDLLAVPCWPPSLLRCPLGHIVPHREPWREAVGMSTSASCPVKVLGLSQAGSRWSLGSGCGKESLGGSGAIRRSFVLPRRPEPSSDPSLSFRSRKGPKPKGALRLGSDTQGLVSILSSDGSLGSWLRYSKPLFSCLQMGMPFRIPEAWRVSARAPR